MIYIKIEELVGNGLKFTSSTSFEMLCMVVKSSAKSLRRSFKSDSVKVAAFCCVSKFIPPDFNASHFDCMPRNSCLHTNRNKWINKSKVLNGFLCYALPPLLTNPDHVTAFFLQSFNFLIFLVSRTFMLFNL